MCAYTVRIDPFAMASLADMDAEEPEQERLADDTQSVEFSVGNPRVEHITGVVHLYRQVPAPRPPAQGQGGGGARGPPGIHHSKLPEQRGLELCCLAIPADLSMAGFCAFCGAYLPAIRVMRVLRREARQRVVCMVLIRFSVQEQADAFFNDFNMKPFSSLEPEIVCRLVFVREVQLLSPHPHTPPPALPPPAAPGASPRSPGQLEPGSGSPSPPEPGGPRSPHPRMGLAAGAADSRGGALGRVSRLGGGVGGRGSPALPPGVAMPAAHLTSPQAPTHPGGPVGVSGQGAGGAGGAGAGGAGAGPGPGSEASGSGAAALGRSSGGGSASGAGSSTGPPLTHSSPPPLLPSYAQVAGAGVEGRGEGAGSSSSSVVVSKGGPGTSSPGPGGSSSEGGGRGGGCLGVGPGVAAAQEAAGPGALGWTELPTCPVCLERLDEHVSGIVTTVCNHQFHSECLQKWGDTSCPVCRYCTQPEAHASRCAACGTNVDLWICLICGHVGCGRYRQGHASKHWAESSHGYALELETQRVWDYVGDNYVHRLIQSKTDGKLVEVPSPGPTRRSRRRWGRRSAASNHSGSGPARTSSCCSRAHSGPSSQLPHPSTGAGHTCARHGAQRSIGEGAELGCEGSEGGCDGWGGGSAESESGSEGELDDDMKEALMASKLDHIAAEYNHLLALQLDSQRAYYEGLLAQQARASEQKLQATVDAAAAARAEAAAATAAAQEAERRRQQLEKKLSEQGGRVSKAGEEAVFLRSMNEQLVANQADLRSALDAAKAATEAKAAQVVELEEQVRDLMVFIQAQRAIQSMDEAVEGTLLPVPAASTSGKGVRAKGQRKGGGK